MPELRNIQTYERINGNDFYPVTERFAKVLQKTGLWNEHARSAFEAFEWKNEDGLVFSNLAQLGYYESSFPGVLIRPHFTIYSKDLDKTFDTHWVCCEFLIKSEQLSDLQTGEYYRHTYRIIENLVFEMSREFCQTGVYFTDEAQDGGDFNGIRTGDIKNLWQFDYALIPVSLSPLYSPIRDNYAVRNSGLFYEFWSVDKWKSNSQ